LKRRLLFITFYFPPDLDAGSFRARALVDELEAQAGDEWDIDVVTTMPNRYHTYDAKGEAFEQRGSVTIRRIPLPDHKSGIHDQSRAFLAYAKQVLRLIKGTEYDGVFATTSRQAGGVLGAWIANRRGVPFYLDVRDIFVDTLEDLLRGSPLKVVLPAVRAAERYMLASASGVNVVSAGFLSYFEARRYKRRFTVYPNGIDDEFLELGTPEPTWGLGQKTVLYAGNIGAGQGLHRIVPGFAKRLGPEWRVQVVGDGGKRRELEDELQKHGVDNVQILDPVPRSQLVQMYQQADVLFLHLNDYKAFRRVLPSKIFEYAASGKPILAGVAGHAESFLEENVDNAALFSPCDVEAGAEALNTLRLEATPRKSFIDQYARGAIVRRMASDILATFGTPKDAKAPQT